MKPNVLRTAVKRIQKHALNFDMDHYVSHRDVVAPCGTVGCLAGWITAGTLAALKKLRDKDDVQERAEKKAQLDPKEAMRLFFVIRWPTRFRDAYRATPGISGATEASRVQAARILKRRVEHFIKTKGRE